MQETKSNWDIVAKKMRATKPIHLGEYTAYWMNHTPRRMMHSLSYYKFASKLIGVGKNVLDIGCNDGIGTFLLAKECGYALGVDFDEKAIQSAQANFFEKFVAFKNTDFFDLDENISFDGVTCFDVIEHILPEKSNAFFSHAANLLTPSGSFVVGTPSEISQKFASEISKKGHINIYTHERLIAELKEHFHHVFLFSANDEVVHTGFYPLAHYFIAVCTGKKEYKS